MPALNKYILLNIDKAPQPQSPPPAEHTLLILTKKVNICIVIYSVSAYNDSPLSPVLIFFTLFPERLPAT